MCVVGAEREGPPSLLTSIWAPSKTHNWLRSPQPHPASVTFLPFLSPHWVAPQPSFYTSLPTSGETEARPSWGSHQVQVRGPHPRPKAAGNHRGALRAGHPTRGLRSAMVGEDSTYSPSSTPRGRAPCRKSLFVAHLHPPGCRRPPHTRKKHGPRPGRASSPEIWHPWELNIYRQRPTPAQ